MIFQSFRQTPSWWNKVPLSWTAHLLRPMGWLYGIITAARMRRTGVDCGVPVICIGNFTAGGSGKTPTALAIADLLQHHGFKPIFLSRGYGGKLKGPLLVDAQNHHPIDVGDEPLLLAQHAPTLVSRDRVAGALQAVERQADVIIMDDGLQNPSLAKQISLAVVDAEIGIGNGLCLPAGPLRAPLAAQWPHVDAVILIGQGERKDKRKGERGAALAAQAALYKKPVFYADLVPDGQDASRLQGKKVLAFAGIGRPEKFFNAVEACGAEIVLTKSFADHYAYQARDWQALQYMAQRQNLLLVTTSKDAVKLKNFAGFQALICLNTKLVFEDEGALMRDEGALMAWLLAGLYRD
jgi:tetraacyldisaccharide 4'-kinase